MAVVDDKQFVASRDDSHTAATAAKLATQMQAVPITDEEFLKLYQAMEARDRQTGKVGNRLSVASVLGPGRRKMLSVTSSSRRFGARP